MPLIAVQQKDLAGSTQFTGRLQVLLCAYARVVQTSVIGGAITQASKNLAARVLSDPGGMAGKLAVSMVSDPGIKDNATTGAGATLDTDRTDAQLDAIIQAVWNSTAWDNVV